MSDTEKENNNAQSETPEETQPTTETEKSGETLESVRELRDKYFKMLQQVEADFENYRKRIQREKADWDAFSVQSFATDILPVVDNFERALSAPADEGTSLRQGIELVYRQLMDALTAKQVKEIPAGKGEVFNPDKHQAVMREESNEFDAGRILDTFVKGFEIRGKVIRYAQVKVSAPKAKSGAEAGGAAEKSG